MISTQVIILIPTEHNILQQHPTGPELWPNIHLPTTLTSAPRPRLNHTLHTYLHTLKGGTGHSENGMQL